MIAVLGVALFIIAGILELVKQHLDLVLWLIIIGGILIGVEVAWGWNRGGPDLPLRLSTAYGAEPLVLMPGQESGRYASGQEQSSPIALDRVLYKNVLRGVLGAGTLRLGIRAYESPVSLYDLLPLEPYESDLLVSGTHQRAAVARE